MKAAIPPPEEMDTERNAESVEQVESTDDYKAEKQVLVLLKGHPGCGKSTFGKAVASRMRWPLVDKDDARDALQAAIVEPHQPPTNKGQTALMDANKISYDVMFRSASTQLGVGLSVIVDCPLARRELFLRGLEIARKHRATVAVIECIPSDHGVWRERLEGRVSAAQQLSLAANTSGEEDDCSSHKPQTWDQLQQLIEGYSGCWQWSTNGTTPELRHFKVVDTCRPLAATVEDACAFLGELTQRSR